MAITGLGGLGGLVSGIDTDTLLMQLMAIERKPQQLMQLNKHKYELKKELWNEVNSSVLSLKGKVESFFDYTTINKKKVTSSDDKYVKVTIDDPSKAVSGTYKITEIEKLATAHRVTGDDMASTWTWSGGDATLQIKVSDDNGASTSGTSSTITISNGMTLTKIAELINSATYTDGSGNSMSRQINATIVDNRLVLERADSGKNKVMTLGSDPSGVLSTLGITTGANNVLTTNVPLETTDVTPDDAKFYVEGIAGAITRSKNTGLTDVINGLKIDLLKTTDTASMVNTDDDVILTVSHDTDAVLESIKSYINQYNSALDLINNRLKEEPVKEATTDSGLKRGMLRSNSLLINLKSGMRTKSADTHSVSGIYKKLSDIGIQTEDTDFGKSGKLLIKDEAKLRAAIENNPTDVQKLFFDESGEDAVKQGNKKVDTGAKGVMAEMYRLLDAYVTTATTTVGVNNVTINTGRIHAEIDGLNKTISGYDERIKAFEVRMKNVELRYRRQFTAMETAMARYKDQMSRVQSQLSNMF